MTHFTAPDGTRLYYEEAGEGPAVLALSGLTRTVRDFDYAAPHLDGIRLIRMDYRGRGRSDRADPASYTVPMEARDALTLLDRLGLSAAAILGSSRGGLIAMLIAATAKDRLTGVALNDIGPELAPAGLTAIMGYIGRRPTERSLAQAVAGRAALMAGFANVPQDRWEAEVRTHYVEGPDGLNITYDPRLREAVEAAGAQPAADLWPLFDALEGLPLCAIRGANSDLLAPETLAEMQRRRPDMIAATVADRGHIPFLDEPEAVTALRAWTAMLPR